MIPRINGDLKDIKETKEIKEIKEINLMVIKSIRSFPIDDVINKFSINEDVTTTIKGLDFNELYKLTDLNQLLITANDKLIKKIVQSIDI